MKIDVPVFNEDGSVKFTQHLSPEEAQHILQFALNFLVTTGFMAQHIKPPVPEEQGELFHMDESNPQ